MTKRRKLRNWYAALSDAERQAYASFALAALLFIALIVVLRFSPGG